ncbi:GNAT family N-acetyltransferase [Stackebrandtia albiflava]
MDVADHTDFPGFLALAGEVEHWFGPMVEVPGFHTAVKSAITAGDAFVVRGPSPDRPHGAMLAEGTGDTFHIGWLVVSQTARGGGIGRLLVSALLDRVTTRPATVDVVTFGADHPAARDGGARVFYERLGFTPGEAAPTGPEGGSRQHYRLRLV